MNKQVIPALSAEETYDLLQGLVPAAEAMLRSHYQLRLVIAKTLVQRYPITLTDAIRECSDSPLASNKEEADIKAAFEKLNLLGCYLRTQKLEEEAAAAAAKLLAGAPTKVARRPRLGRTPKWMKESGVAL